MKVALCISGQPRSFEKGYDYIKKNLLDHYDVDVFIHTWNYSRELLQKIIDVYANSIATVEATETFNDAYFDRYTRVTSEAFPARNTGHMFYSLFKANQLKLEYAMRNDIHYDVSIRCRFDYALSIVPSLSHVEVGKIYVPNERQDPERTMCNDQFAYGDSRTMDLYSQTFMNMNKLYEEGYNFNAEELLSGNLKLYGLTGDNMIYIDMNNPFSPDRYGCMRHSLIRDDFSLWNNLRG